MPIDREELLHIARLARLHIDPDELDGLAEDVERILEFVAALDEIDLPAAPETGCYFDADVHREDRAAEGLDREEALQNAPETDGEYFLVPRILDKGAK